jgi:putative transposase
VGVRGARVTPWFIRPGKPIENAYVESFNGKFRDECAERALVCQPDRCPGGD